MTIPSLCSYVPDSCSSAELSLLSESEGCIFVKLDKRIKVLYKSRTTFILGRSIGMIISEKR